MKMTDIDIERYHELAQQKQKEHRKFLATLKKKAPKNLDKITQEIIQLILTNNYDYLFEYID